MKRKDLKLWVTFTVKVIIIMLGLFFFMSFLLICFVKPPVGFIEGPIEWFPIFIQLLTAFIISTLLTLMVSKHYFTPMEKLVAALQKITAGDFSVRLPESADDYRVRQMNTNFNKMAKELNSIEMLQSDFIQNVSHEFKTPLAAIEGYAILLSAAELPEDLKEYTQQILDSTRQLSSLTGSILQLSRLENQQIVSEKVLFSLDEQLRQALLSLEPLWSRKNLAIDIDLPETLYYGSETLIYQIWSNLFSNAIKFTPDGGMISAKILRESNGISVTVSDTGIGMTPEVQKHIFDKFYQGERNRNITGNGLGLALVKKITELCGGSIKATSQPGKGSSFTIWLPSSTPGEIQSKTPGRDS